MQVINKYRFWKFAQYLSNSSYQLFPKWLPKVLIVDNLRGFLHSKPLNEQQIKEMDTSEIGNNVSVSNFLAIFP